MEARELRLHHAHRCCQFLLLPVLGTMAVLLLNDAENTLDHFKVRRVGVHLHNVLLLELIVDDGALQDPRERVQQLELPRDGRRVVEGLRDDGAEPARAP